MIRVFPRKTKWTPEDPLAFIGFPQFPSMLPQEEMPVRISITFTTDLHDAESLLKSWSQFYKDVRIGGPALGDPGGEFIPGRFIKEGVTITSRGCIRKCGFCFVPEREGSQIREYPIKPGYIIQDNNLLACSRPHIESVFIMLKKQRKRIIFAGGLDPRLLRKWHIDLLNKIKINELWFACDTIGDIPSLEKASELLKHIPIKKKRCYVLFGYGDETPKEAEERARKVLELGFWPFAQLYKGPERRVYGRNWRDLAFVWSNPGIYKKKITDGR